METRLSIMVSETSKSCDKMACDEHGTLLLWEAAHSLQSDHSDSSTFLVAVQKCIDEGNSSEVLGLLSNNQFKDIVEFVGWDIIGLIVPHLNKIPADEIHQEMLQIIFKICNAKEVFLAFSEYLDTVSSILSLQTCLTYLQKSILNIKHRRMKFIQTICRDVSMHFKRLSSCTFAECSVITKEEQTENELFKDRYDDDKFDVSNTEKVDVAGKEIVSNIEKNGCNFNKLIDKRYCCMVNCGLAFIKPFINIIKTVYGTPFSSHKVIHNDPDTKLNIIPTILDYLYRLLTYPLACYPIPCLGNESSKICFCCSQDGGSTANVIIETIFSLKIPFVALMQKEYHINKQDDADVNEEENFQQFGKAMVAYLILVKNIGSKYFPFVLSPHLTFQLTYEPILAFLKSAPNVAEAKQNALELTDNIMSRLEESSLTIEVVTVSQAVFLFERFIDILIFQDRVDLRRRCLKLFTFALKRFKISSRLMILRELISSVVHSGASSFVIQCVKNEAVEIETKNILLLKNPDEDCFYVMFCLAMDVIRQENCDILFNSDRIIASLNYLRFLMLRCFANNDKFKILSKFTHIEEVYLFPLQKCVDQAYSCHINMLNGTAERESDDRQTQDQKHRKDEVLTPNHAIDDVNFQGTQLALNTMDIIRSLLARIKELHCSTTAKENAVFQ